MLNAKMTSDEPPLVIKEHSSVVSFFWKDTCEFIRSDLQKLL